MEERAGECEWAAVVVVPLSPALGRVQGAGSHNGLTRFNTFYIVYWTQTSAAQHTRNISYTPAG